MPKVLGPRSLRLRQEEEELRQEEEEDREGGAGSGARNVSVRGSLVQPLVTPIKCRYVSSVMDDKGRKMV